MKKFKVLAVILALAMVCSLSVFAGNINVGKTEPVLDGIISPNEYAPESQYNLDKAAVAAYNGCWVGEVTDEMGVIYHFAWSDTGLYMGCEVKDPTYAPATTWDAHGGDGGPAADGLQLNLWAKDADCLWWTFGAYADGKLAPRVHYAVDDTNMDGKVQGKAVRDAAGKTYTYEVFMPFALLNEIMGRSEGYKEGTSIPLLMTYMDRLPDGVEGTCYKTMDKDAWPPNDAIDNALVFGAAYAPPAPEPEAVPEAAPADDKPAEPAKANPRTADNTVALIAVLAMAAAAAVVTMKKRAVK